MKMTLKISGGELCLSVTAGNILLEVQEPEIEDSAQLELEISAEAAEIFASQLLAYAKLVKDRRI